MATVKFTKESLNKVGVELLDTDRPLLKCKTCGQVWAPKVKAGGEFFRGWWKCPENSDHTQAAK
jgi:hypothetical protein